MLASKLRSANLKLSVVDLKAKYSKEGKRTYQSCQDHGARNYKHCAMRRLVFFKFSENFLFKNYEKK